MRFRVLLLALPCCVPYFNPPAAEIGSIQTLEEVMDAQATIADPEWSHIGDTSYSDADYARFKDVSARIQALAAHSKKFTRGPAFDQYADKLASTAQSLGQAAEKKDAVLASTALQEMRNTCKACHSEVR